MAPGLSRPRSTEGNSLEGAPREDDGKGRQGERLHDRSISLWRCGTSSSVGYCGRNCTLEMAAPDSHVARQTVIGWRSRRFPPWPTTGSVEESKAKAAGYYTSFEATSAPTSNVF
ncbi:hypothetical protein NL676_037136 [Syzygium grande]|nr:hypothetical protein NL676_037136 [Syzygium grande]